jgi:aspartate aminotransferase
MTGWRLGYAAGPKDIIGIMKKIQSQSTSNPCSITQAAGEAALRGDQTSIQEMVKEFKQRYEYIHAALNAIDGVEAATCSGAFYILPNMQGAIDKMENIEDDAELAVYLLDEAKVATVPGSAFGQPGFLRLSYALDMNSLKEAVKRIEAALTQAS